MTDYIEEEVLQEDGQQEKTLEDILPDEVPEAAVIPLRGMLIFPNTESHLDLGRKFSIQAAQESARNNTEVLLAVQKNANSNLPEGDDLYDIAVMAKIKRTINLPTEGMRVLVTGLYPVKVKEYRIDEDMIRATYETLPEPVYDEEGLEVKVRALRHQFEG